MKVFYHSSGDLLRRKLTSENNGCCSDSIVSQVVILLGDTFQDWRLYYHHGHVKLKEICQEDTRGKQQTHCGVNSESRKH